MESDEIRLDIIDRALQPQTRRAGHTQPRSTARAVGQDGRKTGGFQFNHCVQICSDVFCCSLCVFGGFIEPTRQWTVTTQRLLVLNHR